jgi:hypothetical protein
MKPLNEKEPLGPRDPSDMNDVRNFKAKDPQMLNKMNDPETGLKARQTAQNDAIATRMAKDTASSFGKSPPKPIPYMPDYKRINQQSISGPVTRANEENTMSLIHDKKTLSVADAVTKIMEAEKMAKKDHDQDGKIESGKDEYLGSRIRAAKMAGKLKEEEQLEELSKSTVKSYVMKKMEQPTTTKKDVKGMTNAYNRLKGYKPTSEEVELDEAFPTIADGEKSLRAKEGKTSSGTVTKTKTGLVHARDYEDDSDDTPAKKGRPTGGGAGKSTKKKKLSEMIAAYKEKGIDSLYEEPDNETFTKELKDQKAKFDGKKKGADVAKPSVQAVKVEEEVEQMDERTLTSDETEKKEKYVKSMKKGLSGFKARYGDRAKEVMYATATKMAKKD